MTRLSVRRWLRFEALSCEHLYGCVHTQVQGLQTASIDSHASLQIRHEIHPDGFGDSLSHAPHWSPQ